MTADQITPEALKAYKATLVDKKKMTDSGLVDAEKKAGLRLQVHANCSGLAILIATGNPDFYADYLHTLDGLSPALAKQIAINLRDTQMHLEGDSTTLSKSQVIEAFSAFYHLIKPDTDLGKYIHSLIEKAFEVLELGPIPPMQFAGREAGKTDKTRAR